MHVSIVPLPIVGTFMYMYELKLVLYLSYYRVPPPMMSWEYTYDAMGGIPSLTIIRFGTDTNTYLFTCFCHYSETIFLFSNMH